MNIRPSAAIRQNYNEIAELCRSTREPVYLSWADVVVEVQATPVETAKKILEVLQL